MTEKELKGKERGEKKPKKKDVEKGKESNAEKKKRRKEDVQSIQEKRYRTFSSCPKKPGKEF